MKDGYIDVSDEFWGNCSTNERPTFKKLIESTYFLHYSFHQKLKFILISRDGLIKYVGPLYFFLVQEYFH